MASSYSVLVGCGLLSEVVTEIGLFVGVHDSGAVETLGSSFEGDFGATEIELFIIVQIA